LAFGTADIGDLDDGALFVLGVEVGESALLAPRLPSCPIM